MTQNGETVNSQPLPIALTSDRFWRVEVAKEGGWPAGRWPRVRFGWYPHDLVFVVRGSGPFTLAYGSATVRDATAPLTSVMFTPDGELVPDRVQAATLGEARELGGQAVVALAVLALRAAKDMRGGTP